MLKTIGSLFFVLFCLHSYLGATQIPATITLVNDAPYILTVTVYSHSGDYLGQETLQPGEQKNFTSNLSSTKLSRPGYPDVSLTPFRVIWTCAGGGVYSMCLDGSVGALVRASSCPGLLFCTPKQEEQKPATETPSGKTQNK